MKELGEYLAEVRQNHGVSINEAAEDLNLSVSALENIESGNTRAFKDVYSLKEYVKDYAKYLGLDPDKVLDEFNDFLFEHTSKISLDDILAAKKKSSEKEEKKVSSPYTKIYKKRKNFAPVLLALSVVVLVLLIIYLISINIDNQNDISTELKENIILSKENLYEYTY